MKKMEHDIRIGNVIRAPEWGGLWIVTDIDDDVVQAVAFDASNVSAVQKLDDHVQHFVCHCGGDPDCDTCHGTGRYDKHIMGWARSVVLAPCVKTFILDGFKKAMRL